MLAVTRVVVVNWHDVLQVLHERLQLGKRDAVLSHDAVELHQGGGGIVVDPHAVADDGLDHHRHAIGRQRLGLVCC